MEQPQIRVREHDTTFICGLDTFRVHDTPTGGGKVLDAALPRTMDIVREREEGVARARNTAELRRPFLLLVCAQCRRDVLEQPLPLRLLAALEHLAPDEQVNGVRLLRALHALLEREGENARMVPEPPVVSLRACQACAMDARLLACAEADNCSVVCICYTVRLRVFEGQCCDNEVSERRLRYLSQW